MEEEDDIVILSYPQALSLLPDGDDIHTYVQTAFGLIGADWNRKSLELEMQRYTVELSGPGATKMNHGLVLRRPESEGGNLFIETDPMFMGKWPRENNGNT